MGVFERLLLTVALVLPWSLAWGGNRLATTASPYLQQHAGDAIAWQPWDAEAFTLARDQDKPILLVIGYASCHWCRKMAEETWSDAEVVERLNQDFIAILVDREERPDLDRHYLEVAQSMTGHSGWPQLLFLKPDLTPLFAGNYFPPVAAAGGSGMRTILRDFAREWQQHRERLLSQEQTIREQEATLWQIPEPSKTKGDPRLRAGDRLLKSLQEEERDTRGARFFRALDLSLLLREGVRRSEREMLTTVAERLDAMAAGGVRDLLGGMFHRYSADRGWQIPHYEIMLVDNALLARVYLESFQALGEPRYRQLARGILDGTLAMLREKEGGVFYAGLAADSPDEKGVSHEGRYYHWTPAEVVAILGEGGAAHLGERLRVDGGPLRAMVPGQVFMLQGDRDLQQLAQARSQRPPPSRDRQAITAHNALLASSLALGARILERDVYARAARDVMTILWEAFQKQGFLPHQWADGQWRHQGFLDDYAASVQAWLDLYEVDFDPVHLQRAQVIAEAMRSRFGQPGSPWLAYSTTAAINPLSIEDRDGFPSANGVAWIAWLRLGRWREEDRQEPLRQALPDPVERMPEVMRALDFADDQAVTVVVVGDADDPQTQRLLQTFNHMLLPGGMLARLDPTSSTTAGDWPALQPRSRLDGQSTAYVCVARRCLLPVTQPEALRKLLLGTLANDHAQGLDGEGGFSKKTTRFGQ